MEEKDFVSKSKIALLAKIQLSIANHKVVMCEYLLLIMIVLLTLLANVRPSAKNTIATVVFKRITFIKHDSVDDADKYYFADKHGNVITCYIEER